MNCQSAPVKQNLSHDTFSDDTKIEEIVVFVFPYGVVSETGNDTIRATILFGSGKPPINLNLAAIPVVLNSEGFYVYPKKDEVVSIFKEFVTLSQEKDTGIKTWLKGFWDEEKKNFFFSNYKIIR
jgi:hypothetical protein